MDVRQGVVRGGSQSGCSILFRSCGFDLHLLEYGRVIISATEAYLECDGRRVRVPDLENLRNFDSERP